MQFKAHISSENKVVDVKKIDFETNTLNDKYTNVDGRGAEFTLLPMYKGVYAGAIYKLDIESEMETLKKHFTEKTLKLIDDTHAKFLYLKAKFLYPCMQGSGFYFEVLLQGDAGMDYIGMLGASMGMYLTEKCTFAGDIFNCEILDETNTKYTLLDGSTIVCNHLSATN